MTTNTSTPEGRNKRRLQIERQRYEKLESYYDRAVREGKPLEAKNAALSIYKLFGVGDFISQEDGDLN